MAKSQIAKRVYFNEAGDESRSPRPDTIRGEFRFTNGHVIKITMDMIGEGCRHAAQWMGVSEKMQNAFASAKGVVDDAVENAEAMLERLAADSWVAERESAGPRVSLLCEAIVAAKAKAGQETTVEAVAAKLKENDELRKSALDNPAIAAEYEKIRADRAAAKAKEAAKKAKDAAGDEDALAAF